MNLITRKLTDNDADQKIYTDFVAAHESGSFLQSWDWGEFQVALGKTAVRYGVFEENILVATAQLLLTKIPTMPGSYLYCPYGPLLNTEFDENGITEISHVLIKHIKVDYSQVWFIRLEPKNDLPIDGKFSLHIQPGSSLITDLTLSEQDLLSAMHQKTRYNIKVADRHGVVVSASSLPEAQAIRLLAETSKRQGYKSHSPAYYTKMLEFFSKQTGDCKTVLYYAKLDGKVIASAIMIDSGPTRTYLFGGSDETARNVMAPYALHWQAIRDAKKAGLTKYDWWGTETASGATPGFVQFKMRWGGTQHFYAEPRDVVLNSPWYRAYGALRKLHRLF